MKYLLKSLFLVLRCLKRVQRKLGTGSANGDGSANWPRIPSGP